MAGKQPGKASARWREEDRRADWRELLNEKLNSTHGALLQFHRDFHGDEDKARGFVFAAGGGGRGEGGGRRAPSSYRSRARLLAPRSSSPPRRPAGERLANRAHTSAAEIGRAHV